jgi:hypothetical protein
MAGDTTRSEAAQSFFAYVKEPNTGLIKRIAFPGDVQIGLEGRPSELHLFGRLSVAAKTYSVDLTNKGIINVSNDDTVVGVKLVTAPITGRIKVNLPPAPREGQLHFIKDSSGTAASIPIDIIPATKVLIDEQTSKTLTDSYGSLALIWLSGEWRMLVAGLGASGGGGISPGLSFVTINPEATLTSERHLTGSVNVVMTDEGAKGHVYFDLSKVLTGSAGTYQFATVTVDQWGRITNIATGSGGTTSSASYLVASSEPTLPNRRQMSGGLGTTVTDNGAGSTFTFNVDPAVIPFLSSSNTFTGNNTFTHGLTGSIQQLPAGAGAYIVGIGGLSITTSSNGQIVISGSSGTSFSVLGTGGSTVSQTGTTFTVSSSVYAEKQASYLLLSASAQDNNARTLIVGSGLGTKDLGTGSNYSIFATTDTQAPYVLAFQTGSVPGGRTLDGTNGITVVDQGAGNKIIIGFTPITSRSAAVYYGYCTGSLTWITTGSWTDFGGIPGNFSDSLQNGISRSGSTFTVSQPGYYSFQSYFNVAANSEYIAFRLSGSAGTLAERTFFGNSGPDQSVGADLQALIQLNSGSTFRLQYLTKGSGSMSTWIVSDPLGSAPDQESMRTGEISIFKIADPMILNYVPTAQPFGWQLGHYVDFTQQTSGTFGANGTRTYNNVNWNIENYGNGSRIGIDPALGLTFVANSSNVDYGNAATRNAPLLSVKVQDIMSSFNSQFSYPNMPFRIWVILGNTNASHSGEGVALGIERWGTTSQTVVEKKVFTSTTAFLAQGSYNNANIYTQTADTTSPAHDVMMLQWLNDRQVEHWTGLSLSGSFPDPSTLTLRGTTLLSNASFFQPLISGSNDYGFVLANVTNGTNGTLVSSFKKFKFEYLQTAAGQVIGQSPTTYWKQPSGSLVNLPSSSNAWSTLCALPVYVTSSGAPVLIQYSVTAEKSNPGSSFARITWDGVVQDTSIAYHSTAGTAQTLASTYLVLSATMGLHSANLDFRTDSNFASIILPNEHANLFVQELPFGTTLQVISGSGGSGSDVSASYVLVGATGSIPNGRQIAAGSGITITDNGPGSTLIIATSGSGGGGGGGTVDPSAPIVVTFPTSSVPSGRTLTGSNGIQVIDNGAGSTVVVSLLNFTTGYAWTDGNNRINTTGSVAIDSQGRFANQLGTDVYLFISGTNGTAQGTAGRKAAVLPDTFVSGALQGTNRFSLDSLGRSAAAIGSDIFMWVSGTQGLQGSQARRAVMGGDVVVSGSIMALGQGGFTGSLTQTSTGNPYIVGIGGVSITTNSLGQVLVSGSAGSGGSNNFVTIILSGVAAQGQAAYSGFTSASVHWLGSSSFQPFEVALNAGTFTDTISANVLRSGSTFTLLNGGLYWFHANFNASGSASYTTLRWRSPSGQSLVRTTYRAGSNDQSPISLDGVFSASIGDVWTLEYISSGTVAPWTASNPIPTDGSMVSGEVSIFMLPTNPAPTSFVQTGSYVQGDAFDVMWWPMHEVQGPIAFNVGTGGASGHLTASANTVRFNQPGAIRTSVGPNVAGTTTNNWLVTANLITPPVFNSSSFTVSAWCNPTSFPASTFAKVVHKAYTSSQVTWNSPFDSLGIQLPSTSPGQGALQYFVNISPTLGYSFQANVSHSLGLGTWNHVGLAFDAPNGLMSCYLNGNLIGKTVITGTADHADTSQNGWWAVGGNPADATNEYWPGYIEDVRVASTVRSAAWFTQVWASGRPDASPQFTLTGSGGMPKAPLYPLQMLAGTVTTNTAINTSKQSLGMGYFDPNIIQGFGGSSRRYWYRTVIDVQSFETNMSAAVDIYDVNGIVSFPPGMISASIMSTSNPTANQLQVDLTSILQTITGSGLFEARLWRTVSGSTNSVANCRNARIDVEFS